MCGNAQTVYRSSSKLTTKQQSRQPNKGSTSSPFRKFKVGIERTYPVSTSSGKAKTTGPATCPSLRRTRNARQPTILVVEDHDDTREMLHMLLEMWGCRVVEARDGLEAVEAASRERPE